MHLTGEPRRQGERAYETDVVDLAADAVDLSGVCGDSGATRLRPECGFHTISDIYPHAVDVKRYREGTLIVDLVDPKTGDLVLRGWSVSDIHRAADPQQEQERIELAVRKILAPYPP